MAIVSFRAHALAAVLASGTVLSGNVLAAGSPKGGADDHEARIAALEKRLAEEQEARARARVSDALDRLRINGFLTMGASRANVGGEAGDYEWRYLTKIGDEWNWKADSVAGVQFTWLLDSQWEATLQLLSRFEDEFRVGSDGQINAEWAYLAWRPEDDTAVRFGRMRTPLYMFSEYLDVGFAYPWVRPPVETYHVPFTYYDGVSGEHTSRVGPWKLVTAVGAGRSDPNVVLGLRAEDMGHMSLSLSRDTWTVRLGGTRTSVQSDSPTLRQLQSGVDLLASQLDEPHRVLGPHNRGDFWSVGVLHDDRDWLMIAEATRLYWDDSLIVDRWSHYLTVGHRLGEVMPYVNYGHAYTPVTNDRKRRDIIDAAEALTPAATPTQAAVYRAVRNQMAAWIEQQKSFSLGLRWDVSERVATKFEFTSIYEVDTNGNSVGRFDPIRNDANVDAEVNYPTEGLDTPVYVTSFAITSVF